MGMEADGKRTGHEMHQKRHLLSTLTLDQILAAMPKNHSWVQFSSVQSLSRVRLFATP